MSIISSFLRSQEDIKLKSFLFSCLVVSSISSSSFFSKQQEASHTFENIKVLFARIPIIISTSISSFPSSCQVFINEFMFSSAIENSLYVLLIHTLSMIASSILLRATSIKLSLFPLINIKQSRSLSSEMSFLFMVFDFCKSIFSEFISNIAIY